MSWSEWLSLVALVLAGGALVLSLSTRRAAGAQAARRLLATFATPTPPTPAEMRPPAAARTGGDLVAFVANPTKPGAAELREAAIRACASRSMPEPLWFETSLADPGIGQARRAIELGAVAVIAVGGDGTVRAVAEALAGSGVPMGLIPQGTGNLLARNLDLPLTDIPELLRLALTAPARPIDVGWLRVARAVPDEPLAAPFRELHEHIFLVIAGLGFDAAMVADTDEALKARVGWIAYFLAGARHLHGRRPKLQIQRDDGPVVARRVRSLLIGNCGRLPGGITLLTDAVLDEG